ncbi:MAG: PFL_4703 family integrating conjugative element protein, partial [Geminicoccaceae bacterium]
AALPRRFKTAVEVSHGHIMTLRCVIALMTLICGALWYGWMKAPSSITVHIPPDLRSGIEQDAKDIPAQNIYMFAVYFWQQMNRWPVNGEKDYAKNIHKLQNYVTPRFYDWLEDDFKTKTAKGELRRKIRGAGEIPGHNYEPERVQIIGDGAWLVWLDFEVKEWVNELNTKTVWIRYPMRVVRFDIDRNSNPWGLAMDGYPADEKPSRIERKSLGENS